MIHLVLALATVASAADHPCDAAFTEACVDPSTTVDPGAFIGDGARVGPNMAIGSAVIAPRVVLDGRSTGPLEQPVGDDTSIGRRTTIGPDANIGPNNTIGRGVQAGSQLTVGEFVSVGYAVVLGDNVTLDDNAAVGALVEIGTDSTLSGVVARGSTVGERATITGIVGPGVQIGDDVTVDGRVRKNATLASDSVVEAGSRVGRGAQVGAGAVIEDGAAVRAGAQIPDCSRLVDGDIAVRGATWAGDTTSGCIDIGSYPIDMTADQTNGQVFITDMDIDPASGDVYVIGSQTYDGTLAGVDVPAPSQDLFVAAFNADGGLLWLKPIQSPGTNRAAGLAFHSGALYISGSYSSTLDIDGTTLTNAGAQPDFFVARLNPSDGTHMWSRPLQTTISASLVDIDANDDGLYIGGRFGETLTLPDGPTSVTAFGQLDGYVAHITSAGTWQWIGRIGGTQGDEVTALTALPTTGVAIATAFRGTLEPGSDALTSGYTSTNANDTVVTVVTPAGVVTSEHVLAGNGSNDIAAMDADGSRLVALGSFRGPFAFGATTLQATNTRLGLFEMDLSGTPITGYSLDATGGSFGQDIALRGDVVAVGLRITESETYTYGALNITGAGGSLAALDLSSGTWLWANAVTGDNLAHPMHVAAQPVGGTPGFVVAGRYRNTVQVGASTFTSPQLANAWVVEVADDGTW